ncbi:MAG: ABC transporter substrate-binding protein [Methylomonas sp.]|nr:ABC transporter substrate-binding protein [Methylomonas sp.]PPD20238.1 MAG: toluene tolerance protein [Methylomonas sp.]PPD24003.1 MAG: toluene tolerance protein [Methylomonas sp.]PPD32278.1 MAG: toluene tolerance protein [Methylomonas sp.]PPD40344.1 MAG: toluene tolerance protein [Methylomonas sp.]
MRREKIAVFWVLSCFAMLSMMTGVAKADLQEPQQIIENVSNRLKAQMKEPGFRDDFRKINQFVHTVIYPHADFDLISSLVLGRLWRDASPAERESFKKEFQTLLIRTYSRAFVEFKDWSIRYLPINPDEDPRKVMVRTEILQPGLQPIAVSYRMLNQQGEWKVYDILIEGVSLVTNYRTSFRAEVEKTGSLQEVINQLAKRNSEALSVKNHS